VRGKDLKLGANVGELERGTAAIFSQGVSMNIENYNRVLGAHKSWNAMGEIVKLDVVAGSGDPYKRTGGADSILDLLYDQSDTAQNYVSPTKILTDPIFTHEFEATTDSKSYRYYVQAIGAVTATELWIEVEYVSVYDDTSGYSMTKVISDESVSARANEDDWSQYIEVTGIAPSVASKVRIRCFCSYYDATDKIYIDPLVEIT